MTEKYKDIIDLPRHQWRSCPKMSAVDRGAQFAPFAALTGYESMIEEVRQRSDDENEPEEEQ